MGYWRKRAGVSGLIRLNALGNNAIARTIGFLPLLGFAAFILGEGLRLVGFISLDDALYNTLAGIAWIAVLAGMLVVGKLHDRSQTLEWVGALLATPTTSHVPHCARHWRSHPEQPR